MANWEYQGGQVFGGPDAVFGLSRRAFLLRHLLDSDRAGLAFEHKIRCQYIKAAMRVRQYHYLGVVGYTERLVILLSTRQ